MSEELKPCPFCGGPASHNDGGNSVYGRWWWSIWCEECGIAVHDREVWDSEFKLKLPPKECFERWNKRSAPSQARLSEAVKVLEPFAEVYDYHLQEHDIAARVGGYVPLEDEFPIDGIGLKYFRLAKAFITTLGGEK